MSKFGKLIQKLRVDSGKTLREVSEAIGLSVSKISDIEHGRRGPLSADLIEKFVFAVEGGNKELDILQQAAAKQAGAIEVPFKRHDPANDLVYALARADHKILSEEEVSRNIQKLIELLQKERE